MVGVLFLVVFRMLLFGLLFGVCLEDYLEICVRRPVILVIFELMGVKLFVFLALCVWFMYVLGLVLKFIKCL